MSQIRTPEQVAGNSGGNDEQIYQEFVRESAPTLDEKLLV
jgi:hypothetical protein